MIFMIAEFICMIKIILDVTKIYENKLFIDFPS